MTQILSARALALSLASAIALAAAAPTQAAPASNDPDTITVVVPAADLNLTSGAGAKILLARIHRAAETVCGIEPAAIQFDLHRLYQACVAGPSIARSPSSIIRSLRRRTATG